MQVQLLTVPFLHWSTICTWQVLWLSDAFVVPCLEFLDATYVESVSVSLATPARGCQLGVTLVVGVSLFDVGCELEEV